VPTQRLGDKAEVQVFGSSQLGKDKELLQKLKLGQITFSLPSSVMSSVRWTFGVFEMPYIIKDRDHMKRVQETMATRSRRLLKREGLPHHRPTSKTASATSPTTSVRSTSLKIWRGQAAHAEGRVARQDVPAYGANPTPMAFSEVFTALQTGVIDGQENPYAQIWSAKFQEVQKYLSITGHVYTPAYVLVAENQWQRLPEDVRADLEACGTETQGFVYEHAAKLETELLDVIKAAGVEVNEADKDAFIAASASIYEEFGNSVEGGAELIERVQALASGS
jgi:TRAP-type C4-dicarboxylate transport system substrate-binding protein